MKRFTLGFITLHCSNNKDLFMPIFKKNKKIEINRLLHIFIPKYVMYDQLLFAIFLLQLFTIDVNSHKFATSICSISSKVG